MIIGSQSYINGEARRQVAVKLSGYDRAPHWEWAGGDKEVETDDWWRWSLRLTPQSTWLVVNNDD